MGGWVGAGGRAGGRRAVAGGGRDGGTSVESGAAAAAAAAWAPRLLPCFSRSTCLPAHPPAHSPAHPQVRAIADLELAKSAERLAQHRGVAGLQVSQAVMQALVEAGYSQAMGARELRRAVTALVDDALCDAVLREEVRCARWVLLGAVLGAAGRFALAAAARWGGVLGWAGFVGSDASPPARAWRGGAPCDSSALASPD